MKFFTNDELRKKKLFKFILDISEKEIHNFGFQYFDENIHYNNFLELINRILDEYYQLPVNKFGAIKFKENFEKYKNSSIIGDITINSNKDGNIPSRKMVRYHGDFVYYSILNYWLFSRVFNDEIEKDNKVFTRVKDILGSNYAELLLNPLNDLIIRPFKGVVTNEFPEKSDVGDYVQLFLDEISKNEKEKEKKDPPFVDKELDKKGLPSFNIPQRFFLLDKMKIIAMIRDSDNLEKNKAELLSVILDISLTNSIKLLNDSYGRGKNNDEKIVKEYLLKRNLIL